MSHYGPHASEGPPDPRTGTRRMDLWREPTSGGQWGDQARGDGWTALYINADTRCKVSIYPILCEDGSYGIEEQSIAYDTDGPEAIHEHGYDTGEDTGEITYEWASVFAFDSLEAAQKEADRLGEQDYSYAIQGRVTA